MMETFFIKEFEGKEIKKVHCVYGDDIFKKIDELKNKSISIYRGECVLDWS